MQTGLCTRVSSRAWVGGSRQQPKLHRLAAQTFQQAPSKDVTADLMQAAITLALKTRLKEYQGIRTDVECDAWGLLEGKFRSVAITGQHWRTPLQLTAHRLEVDMGNMEVDYGALVWQQRLALRNAPTGYTRIVLSAADLGNFMTHPIFKQVAATAIHGSRFEFDRDSVHIQHSPVGEVRFEGVWATNGERYRVVMRPKVVAPAAAAGGTAAAGRRQAPPSGGGGQLQVGAQHLTRNAAPPDLDGAKQVASGLAHFFTHMSLDLQGIELKSPSLQLHARNEAAGDQGDLLDIGMKMRLRSFPPMDMAF